MTTIDFGKAIQDAKGASFEPLPVGDYDVEVAKSEAVTSQNGKPMIKTTMRVVSGPYEKRPIINNFVLSLENPQATAIFFRHMKAFGLTEEWFASLGKVGSLEPVASALIGRRVRLSVAHREWNGEMRNEVKAVKPYTGAPPQVGPAGPSGPLAGPPSGGPVAGPTAPVPAPAPVAPPAPTPIPAPVAAAPVAPQVQPVPQPPAPEVPAAPAAPAVPTASTVPPAEVAAAPTPSTPATSEAAPTAPPALPY